MLYATDDTGGHNLLHRAPGVADVLRELFDEHPAPLGARFLGDARHIAELAAGGELRVGGGDGVGFTRLKFFYEAKFQLGAQIGLAALALRQPAQFTQERSHEISSLGGLRTSPMARANVSHFESSATSCLRPSGVSL